LIGGCGGRGRVGEKVNEITLSNDINVITAEINSYKQVAGQAIFEIGRRLKHVKENDLTHGQFGCWLAEIGIDRTFATRTMKVVSELSDSNYATSHNLGMEALYQIATLPEPERTKPHTIPSTGETKTVDEMTVRELREVKKTLKEKERQLKQAQESERIAIQQLERLENTEPKVIEKEVIKEVLPAHIKEELETHKRNLNWAKREIERLTEEQQANELHHDDFDESEAERINKRLRFEAEKNVLEMKIHVDRFLKDVSITAFRKGAIAAADKRTKDKLKESVESLKEFIREMELALNGRIKIGGMKDEY